MKMIAVVLGCVVPAWAQEEGGRLDGTGERSWVVEFEPAAWYTSPGGMVVMPGGSAEADLADVNLDSPRLSPFAEVRVRGGEWSLELSGYGYEASGRGSISSGMAVGGLVIPAGSPVEASLGACSFEAALGYRVHEFRSEGERGDVELTLDVTGGVRAHALDLEVTGAGGRAEFDGVFAEPTVGMWMRFEFSRGLSLDVDASVGGMFLENSTSISWDILVGFRWDLGNGLAAQGGYRQHAFLLEEGEGIDRFRWRGAMAGVYAGMVFRF